MRNTDIKYVAECEQKILQCSLERRQLSDVTALAGEIKQMLVRYNDALKDIGFRRELRALENWLETEREAAIPASVVYCSGLTWLEGLRDKLKLHAEEAQRFDSEGGPPQTKEQLQKTEDLMSVIRRIDMILCGECEALSN